MSNREALRSLIDRASISQGMAAEYIAKETKVPCSERSVRSWLADTALVSARPCPDWALEALERKLRRLKKIV